MKKYNKEIVKKLLIVYFVLLSIVTLPILYKGGNIVNKFIYDNIYILVLSLLITFLINYLILNKLIKEPNLDDITNIVISEVFNDDELELVYSSEIKNMVKKLKEEKKSKTYSMEKYKESEKIRTEFTANVTHELKTPLTSIIGYSELIEMGMGSEKEVKKFAKTIREDSGKLLLIIDDIITLSKFDDPTSVKIEFEYFNMGELLKNLILNIESIAMAKNINIISNIKDIYVYADKSKIKDLVNNLLSNSIKYNVENGTVKVKFYKEEENVKLEVEDTGIGISNSDKNRIFERFYVVDKARGKKSGTGLGLAIVKHVAILHKGSIELESTGKKGSKFIFTFPQKLEENLDVI